MTFAEMARELFDCWTLEDRHQRKLFADHPVNLREQAYGKQGMSSDFKKVVGNAHTIDVQKFLPDFAKLNFKIRLWRTITRPISTSDDRFRFDCSMGRLSPLDGIGPTEIGARQLLDRAADGQVEEVIIATNFTAEGEATAHVLAEALGSRGIRVTRLARGVPIGSELEYVDLGTIAHAFVDRR